MTKPVDRDERLAFIRNLGVDLEQHREWEADCKPAMAIEALGPMVLEEIALLIGCTRERIRQIQNKAFQKLAELQRDPHPIWEAARVRARRALETEDPDEAQRAIELAQTAEAIEDIHRMRDAWELAEERDDAAAWQPDFWSAA